MKWLGMFNGGGEVVNDIFDKDNGLLAKSGEWIGNQNFTEEEKSEINLEQVKAVQKHVVDTLSESTDRSKARRDIAVHFMKFFTLMLFMCGMTYPIDQEWSAVWFDLATSLSVGGLVTSIGIFFFGSHILTRHNETKLGKPK